MICRDQGSTKTKKKTAPKNKRDSSWGFLCSGFSTSFSNPHVLHSKSSLPRQLKSCGPKDLVARQSGSARSTSTASLTYTLHHHPRYVEYALSGKEQPSIGAVSRVALPFQVGHPAAPRVLSRIKRAAPRSSPTKEEQINSL
jgi:hypothetical protein